jgi:hypothetical protein
MRKLEVLPFNWSYEEALELIRTPLCDTAGPAPTVSEAEFAQLVAYLKSIQ